MYFIDYALFDVFLFYIPDLEHAVPIVFCLPSSVAAKAHFYALNQHGLLHPRHRSFHSTTEREN